MPVIPTFSGFAATPALGESWLGGRRIDIAQQEIAQRSAEAAQAAAAQYARMQNDRVLAEMQYSAQAEAQAKEHLLKQQDLEINRAYQNQMLGFEQSKLEAQMQASAQAAERDRLAREIDYARLDVEDTKEQRLKEESERQLKAQQDLAGKIQGGMDPVTALFSTVGLPEGMYPRYASSIMADQFDETLKRSLIMFDLNRKQDAVKAIQKEIADLAPLINRLPPANKQNEIEKEKVARYNLLLQRLAEARNEYFTIYSNAMNQASGTLPVTPSVTNAPPASARTNSPILRIR